MVSQVDLEKRNFSRVVVETGAYLWWAEEKWGKQDLETERMDNSFRRVEKQGSC